MSTTSSPIKSTHQYRAKRGWPDDIEQALAAHVADGYCLHVCCGKSPIGDVRVDADPPGDADLRADMDQLPFEDETFDSVPRSPRRSAQMLMIVAKRGRKHGLELWVASQRPSGGTCLEPHAGCVVSQGTQHRNYHILQLITNEYTMPVHLDSHTPDVDLTPGTTKSDIVAFLYSNPEFGYRPAEIREELDIPRGTATTTLKRLHESGYVGKTTDSYYHALESREDVRRYVASLAQLDRMFGHHTEADTHTSPDSDSTDADSTVDDAAAEAELAELEAEIEDGDE